MNGKSCWFCHEEPTHAVRDLHQVGYRDYYDDDTKSIVVLTKKVWAPCGTYVYACDQHPLKPTYFDIGVECPHGLTGKERGVPVPNIPLVGKTAIVLDTDIL